MFVSIYYKPSLFNAHTVILIVHIFMNVNKLCLNQTTHTPNTAFRHLPLWRKDVINYCLEFGDHYHYSKQLEIPRPDDDDELMLNVLRCQLTY